MTSVAEEKKMTFEAALAYNIRSSPQSTRGYSVMILIASLVGLFTASGFGMGAILGTIAGIIAIVRK